MHYIGNHPRAAWGSYIADVTRRPTWAVRGPVGPPEKHRGPNDEVRPSETRPAAVTRMAQLACRMQRSHALRGTRFTWPLYSRSPHRSSTPARWLPPEATSARRTTRTTGPATDAPTVRWDTLCGRSKAPCRRWALRSRRRAIRMTALGAGAPKVHWGCWRAMSRVFCRPAGC